MQRKIHTTATSASRKSWLVVTRLRLVKFVSRHPKYPNRALLQLRNCSLKHDELRIGVSHSLPQCSSKQISNDARCDRRVPHLYLPPFGRSKWRIRLGSTLIPPTSHCRLWCARAIELTLEYTPTVHHLLAYANATCSFSCYNSHQFTMGLKASSLFSLLTFLFVSVAAEYGPYYNDGAYDAGMYGTYPINTYMSTDVASPRLNILKSSEECRNDLYWVFSPRGRAVSEPSAMILDWEGNLVWTKSGYDQIYNLQVQEYAGEKFLTFWAGTDAVFGHGAGVYYMVRLNWHHD